MEQPCNENIFTSAGDYFTTISPLPSKPPPQTQPHPQTDANPPDGGGGGVENITFFSVSNVFLIAF